MVSLIVGEMKEYEIRGVSGVGCGLCADDDGWPSSVICGLFVQLPQFSVG